MKDQKKQSYKEKHGTTRVGDFLKSIGKSGVLQKVIGVAGGLATGNVLGAVKNVLGKSEDLTPEQKGYALKLAEMDAKEDQEVSKRWAADMASDSWYSKNVRPLSLMFLTFSTTLFVVLDSAIASFEVDSAWVELLKTLLITVYVAYFGSRGVEKYKKITTPNQNNV